jgi:diacylglycerol kinase (ATP)
VACALRGIGVMLRSQHNAWIHAVVTLAVIGAGFYFGLSAAEWCWIVLAVVSVWTAEALNTALEFLTDVASPAFHPLAGRAKDVAAGAVLIAALGAVVIGLLVFGPHAWAWYRSWQQISADFVSRGRWPLRTSCEPLTLESSLQFSRLQAAETG